MISIIFEGGDGVIKPEVFGINSLTPELLSFSNDKALFTFIFKQFNMTFTQIKVSIENNSTSYTYSNPFELDLAEYQNQTLNLGISFVNENGETQICYQTVNVPKLEPTFNASKITTHGNVTITDGITSRLNSSNNVDSDVKNSDLYNRNNIEFQFKFTANGTSGYVFLVSTNSPGDSIGVSPGYISLNRDWHYFDMGFSYSTTKWYYLIVNLNKRTHTFTLQLFDIDKNPISSYSETRTSWFSNDNLTWQYGLGQEWGGYPSNGCYDLKETWIKDLDTNEILVPWFD